MMDQIAAYPQMRQEMMQKMMHDPATRSAMADRLDCGHMAMPDSPGSMHGNDTQHMNAPDQG